MSRNAPQSPPSAGALHPSNRTAQEQEGAWLVTYTDLVSLILAFFVLMFSMSTMPSQKWKEVSQSLSRSETPPIEYFDEQEKAELTIGGKNLQDALNLDYLSALLDTQLSKTGDAKGSIIHRFEDKLAISLPGDLLFISGSASLSPRGKTALADLSSVLRNLDNRIDVFGHTDPDVVTGKRYTSNWELSLARALTVAFELKRGGYSRNVPAYGAAASQFDFISPRIDHTERKRLSRRVDIMISSKSGLWE